MSQKVECTQEVQALLTRKLDIVQKIRELKAESMKATLDLVRAGAPAEILGSVPRW